MAGGSFYGCASASRTFSGFQGLCLRFVPKGASQNKSDIFFEKVLLCYGHSYVVLAT